jgi:hypothetical protein
MTKKAKRYEILGFEQVCNVVTDANFTNFMTDMLGAFGMYFEAIDQIKAKYPKECEGKSNWQICKFHFDWIDDGKNDLKSMKFTTPQTGEVVEIKINRPII